MKKEYFVTCFFNKYPDCRFPDGREIQRTKPCFKCADNPGPFNEFIYSGTIYRGDDCSQKDCTCENCYIEKYGGYNDDYEEDYNDNDDDNDDISSDDGDDDLLNYEDWCNYDGNGRCENFRKLMPCVHVCPGTCITTPCPESWLLAYYRCSVGELDEDEKAFFEVKTEIHSECENVPAVYEYPKFQLRSREELDLTGLESRFEHKELMDRFNEVSSPCNVPAEIDDMMRWQGLADNIRAARDMDVQPGSRQLSSPVSPTPEESSIKPSSSSSSPNLPEKRGRNRNKRSEWVIEQHKEGLSNSEIFKKWNSMTYAERNKIDPGTYKSKSSDGLEIKKYSEKFENLSNIARIVNDFKKTK